MAASTLKKFPKLGPGTLKFGETASAQEFAARCSSVFIEPELDDEDSVPLLDGEDFTSEGQAGGAVSGTLYQDFDKDGLTAWIWKNAGKVLPFVFKPNNNEAMQIKGKAKIKPIKIGGAVKKENTSDFSFPLVGDMPEMTFTAGA